MPYIKIKKVWTKKLDVKFVESIFNLMKESSPVPEKEWSDIDFVGAVAKYGQFVHPETDKYDDSEGVQPKEIRKLSSYLEADLEDFLIRLIPALNRAAGRNYFSNLVSDGFISWSQVFLTYVLPVFEQENYEDASVNEKLGIIISSIFPTFQRFNSIEKNVLEKIGLGVFDERTVEEAINAGILPQNERHLRMEYINLDAYFEDRRKLWYSAHKIKPQSNDMLRVNPYNFDKRLLNIVNDAFGVRQIGKLEENKQKWVSLLIDNFGLNLLSFPIEIVKRTNLVNQLSFGSDNCKDFSHVIEKLVKVDKGMNLGNLKLILIALHRYEALEDFIMKQESMKSNDLDVIFFIANIVNQITNRNVLNTLQKIDPVYFRVFFRYRVQSHGDIIQLMNLFNSVGDMKTTIPIVTGKVGSYTYEIIEKDNPVGLILGYATDCCQVISGAGEDCLRAGYQKKDSTFFVVRKGDTVYAQSWMWKKDKTKKGSAVCFDSVEVLGKDLDKSKDILKCYLEASKELSKHFDVVYAGADGNRMPKGLDKAGEYLSVNEIYEAKMDCPWDVYSDLTGEPGGLVIFNERKK